MGRVVSWVSFHFIWSHTRVEGEVSHVHMEGFILEEGEGVSPLHMKLYLGEGEVSPVHLGVWCPGGRTTFIAH